MSSILTFIFLVSASIILISTLRRRRQRPPIDAKIRAIQQLPARHWSPNYLESYRQYTDPIADQVIESIFKDKQENEVNELLLSLVRNNGVISGSMPPEVRTYFATTAALPNWADEELIALGERVFAEHGPLISLILSCKSLPQTYVCAKGAMVLYQTGRLGQQAGRMNVYTHRIVETSQFVINALSSGGLSPRGKGIITTQKIRLIHAAIRYFIHKHGWDSTVYGQPINQEDMAGTLMAFSALVLEGLELIRVRLSEAEKEAFMHCWRIIGYFMGIDAALLPNNLADGLKLGHAIMAHQMQESVQGKALMAALVEFKENISPEGKLIGMVPELMRFMIGNEISDMLGLPADPVRQQQAEARVRKIVGIGETISRDFVWASPIVAVMGRLMLEGMLTYMNHGQRIRFELPESLKKDWNLQSTYA